MTRLFIRFYLGVLLILFVAWCIQAFVFRQRIIADNTHIVEDTLGGGVRLARSVLEAAPDAGRAEALENLQTKFDYAVRVIPGDQVPAAVKERFSAGDDVVMHMHHGLFLLTPLSSGEGALQFGPLTMPRGPNETDLMIGLGAVLLLVAIAIAILLRPVARQLRLFERTAIAIAGGDLSARVDERRAHSARTLARAFNDMADRTEGLLKTQRELLQAVSHELRTPLSRISFAIDLIRTAKDERQRESRLKSLELSAHELDELVGELLRYVRLETNQPQLEVEQVDLLPLVEELVEKITSADESKQLEIGAELKRGDVQLFAHRTSLERAVGNLLANAVRFCRQRVVVDARWSSLGTTIDVDDDGPGIPASDRSRVFEPFVRLDESGRGAGLGLALVKRIVANHGGTATALESPLGGCRIRTTWPAVLPHQVPASGPAAAASPS